MFTEKIFAATIIFSTLSSTPSANDICKIADECGISMDSAYDVFKEVSKARDFAMEDIAADMAAEYAASMEINF